MITKRCPKCNTGRTWFKKGHKINLGRKCLEETKRKISKALKGKTKMNSGRKKGFKHSEETKRKMSKIKMGKRSYLWQGGKSFEPYPIDWTQILRKSIRERDNYICQLCGIHQDELKGWNKKLDIHHIDYNKDNLDPKNLISLCRNCHLKTNQNRNYWTNYFNNINEKLKVASAPTKEG